MMQEEEGLVVRGRLEIDTRRPFRSVREAVALFGEKILAGETLKQMQRKASNEEKSVEKANEEETLMAHCLISLRQELEDTKRELHKMKAKEIISHFDKPEIEELKFVESTSKVGTINDPDSDEDGLEFNRKRSVKFASPPLLTKVLVSNDNGGEEDEQTHTLSKKKIKRKKPLVPLIGGLFSKKKGTKNGES